MEGEVSLGLKVSLLVFALLLLTTLTVMVVKSDELTEPFYVEAALDL